jgi:uncharacterized membrane protein HdeD (DUF308 family)
MEKGKFSNRKPFLIEGLLLVLLGALAILWPNVSTHAIELILGWLFAAGGVIQAVRAFQMRGSAIVFSLLLALLYLLFGAGLLLFPVQGVKTITFFLAIVFFIQGFFQIVAAIRSDMMAFRFGMLLSGIVAIFLSFLIWSEWPGDANWAIGLLVGVNLIFFGLSQILSATLVGKS